MKALKEVGLRKAWRFVFFTFWYAVFRMACFPQIRTILLKTAGAKVGHDTVIGPASLMNLYRTGPRGLTIGNSCFIGDEVMLDLAGEIILEDQVTLSARSFVLTHTNVGYKDHPLQKYIKSFTGKVVFRRGAFIGVGVMVMPNVEVGENGAAASGAVVTEDIPKMTIVGGVPAKVIKKFGYVDTS
jgi:acetyltransferase-like isoleucine patch superfamily enzyme